MRYIHNGAAPYHSRGSSIDEPFLPQPEHTESRLKLEIKKSRVLYFICGFLMGALFILALVIVVNLSQAEVQRAGFQDQVYCESDLCSQLPILQAI